MHAISNRVRRFRKIVRIGKCVHVLTSGECDDRVMEQQIKAPYPEVQPMNGYYRDKNQDANYFLKGHGISNMLCYSVVPSEQCTSI